MTSLTADHARLILDYLRVAASWPIIVFVLGVVALVKFKKPIIALIDRIVSIKFPGGSVELNEETGATVERMATKLTIGGDDQALAKQVDSDSEVQFNEGVKYMTGDGVPQDNAKAVAWYRKAADGGHALAQGQLGVMYMTGKGVPQDNAEAVTWYRKAADGGHALAQFMLGAMYAEGKGVPQDNNETAYMWFNLAASRSTGEDRDRAAKVRDKLAKRLTTEQLAAAQRRAREWDAAHPREAEFNRKGKDTL